MKLSELIRKRDFATVTVATLATVTPINPPSVATVATVDVANPTEPKTAPLTAGEEKAIGAWLAHIGETDQEIIDDVLRQCQQDADARDYFTGRAAAETSQDAQGEPPGGYQNPGLYMKKACV